MHQYAYVNKFSYMQILLTCANVFPPCVHMDLKKQGYFFKKKIENCSIATADSDCLE